MAWLNRRTAAQRWPFQRSARPAPPGRAVKAHTLPGALAAAAVTRSPAWPGNGTAAQRRQASRHATGLASVDANAHAWRGPVAVTAVMPGRSRPRVVLTMRHDGAEPEAMAWYTPGTGTPGMGTPGTGTPGTSAPSMGARGAGAHHLGCRGRGHARDQGRAHSRDQGRARQHDRYRGAPPPAAGSCACPR